jgi:hypothetical protein
MASSRSMTGTGQPRAVAVRAHVHALGGEHLLVDGARQLH